MLRAGADADADEAGAGITVAQLDTLIAEYSASGLTVTTRIEGTPADLPGATSRVAYRVIQEGLTNAHKHGSSNRAHVLMQYQADQIAVTITNPTSVSARTVAEVLPASGHGLQGVRERVHAVGGRVDSGPTATGYVLRAVLPLVVPAGATPGEE